MTNVVNLIQAVDTADSAQKLLDAVNDLAEVRSPEAIPTLIQVLGFNNPGASVAAVDGLIAIGEAVVEPLLTSLDDYNYGARAWAIRVFAGIGDPRALELLLKAASSDFSLSVRRAACKGLGSLKWHLLNPQQQKSTQTEVLDTLLMTINDGEWVVRYATIVALESLHQALSQNQGDLATKIKDKLTEICQQDPEISVQYRAKLALINIVNN
jgi:phycocyanobilin lyase beta subunit